MLPWLTAAALFNILATERSCSWNLFPNIQLHVREIRFIELFHTARSRWSLRILARIELALVKGFVGGLKTLAVWSPSNLTPSAFRLSPFSTL